jgi:hypothetical protein
LSNTFASSNVDIPNKKAVSRHIKIAATPNKYAACLLSIHASLISLQNQLKPTIAFLHLLVTSQAERIFNVHSSSVFRDCFGLLGHLRMRSFLSQLKGLPSLTS